MASHILEEGAQARCSRINGCIMTISHCEVYDSMWQVVILGSKKTVDIAIETN